MKNIKITPSFIITAVIGSALFFSSAGFASEGAASDEHAAEEKVMHVEKAAFGDAAAGQQKASTCAACHGADGNSTNADWPTLAGQHPEYVYEQLKMIKDGTRSAPLMVGQLNDKSDTDLKNLAAYFSGLDAKSGEADADLLALGQSLYRGGNAEKAIPACASCHGATGAGNPLSRYPAIAGQQSGYVLKALNDYASGARSGNAQQKIMKDVAGLMSDAEKAAVASYVRGLQ